MTAALRIAALTPTSPFKDTAAGCQRAGSFGCSVARRAAPASDGAHSRDTNQPSQVRARGVFPKRRSAAFPPQAAGLRPRLTRALPF